MGFAAEDDDGDDGGFSSADKQKTFQFDYIFNDESRQEDVFESLGVPAVNSVLKDDRTASNVGIFAYGQTGSGKTFTMYGNKDNIGLVPRMMEYLFKRGKEFTDNGDIIAFSTTYFELYCDKINDLYRGKGEMAQSAPPTKVVLAGQDCKIKGITELPIDTAEQILKLKKKGDKR